MATKSGVTTEKDVLADTVKAVQALSRKRVLIGIPEGDTRDNPPGETITNAMIGYISEYGSPAQNIPPRPHLVPGVRAVQPQLVKLMKEAAQTAMRAGERKQTPSERDREIDKTLTKAGLLCVASVQKIIQGGIAPSLAPSTIYTRQHRKVAPHMGTTPLIDTGQYWQHITFVIDKQGENAKGVAPSIGALNIKAP